jgi:hypothetical protein
LGIVSGMTEEQEVKVRENRRRRAAERQGLRVVKSRRRDPRATDYGCYMITNDQGYIVHGTEATGRPELSLDDVERYSNQ